MGRAPGIWRVLDDHALRGCESQETNYLQFSKGYYSNSCKFDNTQQYRIGVGLLRKSISGDWRLSMLDEHVKQLDGVENISSSNIRALMRMYFSLTFHCNDKMLTAKRSLLAVSLDDSSLYCDSLQAFRRATRDSSFMALGSLTSPSPAIRL